MPGMTGIDFLFKVRKQYPSIIRILLTGYADIEVAIRAVNEVKLFRYLVKPWKDDELKALLKSAMKLRNLTTRNQEVLDQLKKQEDSIRSLEAAHPGISEIKRDATGNIIIEDV
jgi:DNA-binding NtrC family response regulator